MADRLTAEQRSKNMRAIRHKDTKPELLVRTILHCLGYRFHLHSDGLPGKPDIIFSKRRKIVLIHGCFWHGHSCRVGHTPRSNKSYWGPKIGGNIARDARNEAGLTALGWEVMTVWECELKATEAGLPARLIAFLGPPKLHQASSAAKSVHMRPNCRKS